MVRATRNVAGGGLAVAAAGAARGGTGSLRAACPINLLSALISRRVVSRLSGRGEGRVPHALL